MIKLTSGGRGGGYSRRRGLMETVLDAAYVADWPARAWGVLPRARRVSELACTLHVRAEGRRALRFGFISDLHIGPTTPPAVLDAAFDALARADLDLLLLGGDYVFLEATRAKAARLTELVDRVPVRIAKLGVLGNHDLWTEHALIEDALARAGVELCVNRSFKLAGDHDDVVVVGLDDPWTGAPDPARALASAGDAPVRIGLCHSPDALPLMEDDVRPAIFVCGHTHGGQIATPWGPIIIPGPVGKRYPSGFHDTGKVHMFVSRGVGATELPMRTWARPDVSVFTLSAARTLA